MGETTELGMLFCASSARSVLIGVDDIKTAGKKQDLCPTRKKLMKLVHQWEPTSFLDHVYLECTQREWKSNDTIVNEHRKMFESRIFGGATEKLTGWEKSRAKTVSWSTVSWPKNALRDFANWKTKRQNSCTKARLLAWMITISRNRNLNRVENCQKYARPDILASFWSVLEQSQNGQEPVSDV